MRGILRFAEGGYLVRTPGYRRLVPSTDLQMIDMGIAMRHLEVSAKELGISGFWEMMGDPGLDPR